MKTTTLNIVASLICVGIVVAGEALLNAPGWAAWGTGMLTYWTVLPLGAKR